MKVHLTFPLGTLGFDRVVEMPAALREGDQVHIGPDGEGDEFEVRTVVWYPDEPGMDVYVVLGRVV